MQQLRRYLSLAPFALAACGGGGGGGGGVPPAPIEPTLSSIQSNIFTPTCTRCHAGANAPVGLRLEQGVSFGMLVNVPSAEVPALLRVNPGNPNASYLIQKLEGTAAVGGRMPLGGAPLAQSTINVIRQWITNGAPASIAASSASSGATLSLLSPAPATNSRPDEAPPVAELLVAADHPLDTTLLQAGTVVLEASGGDGVFDDGNDSSIPLAVVVTSHAPTVMRLIPGRPLGPDHYRLTISGSAPLALADLGAVPIDGDRDDRPGGDFVAEFVGGPSR